ncbi:MAG: hypothetical protein K2X74_04335 [Acetobacteraceae bacterium]|nr:hypothetical protein [Acetobacteraceae bacterium]
MTKETHPEADSLLPYDRWTEVALRAVVVDALDYAARNGLPGEHHFYITFRTDYPGVTIPGHLKARFPQEMTIVLQHQFWDLRVDRAAGTFSVGLSFGGVPATLAIPVAAIGAFADPHVQFGLRFGVEMPREEAAAPATEPETPDAAPAPVEAPGQVLRLDAFRRRPAKE